MPEERSPKDEMEDLMKRDRSADKEMTPATMARHTVVQGDTLSGLALHFYGSGAKEKWMAIYDANRKTIGDDPNRVKPGIKLRNPKLEG